MDKIISFEKFNEKKDAKHDSFLLGNIFVDTFVEISQQINQALYFGNNMTESGKVLANYMHQQIAEEDIEAFLDLMHLQGNNMCKLADMIARSDTNNSDAFGRNLNKLFDSHVFDGNSILDVVMDRYLKAVESCVQESNEVNLYEKNATMKLLGYQYLLELIGIEGIAYEQFIDVLNAHKENNDKFAIAKDFFCLGVIWGKRLDRAKKHQSKECEV